MFTFPGQLLLVLTLHSAPSVLEDYDLFPTLPEALKFCKLISGMQLGWRETKYSIKKNVITALANKKKRIYWSSMRRPQIKQLITKKGIQEHRTPL